MSMHQRHEHDPMVLHALAKELATDYGRKPDYLAADQLLTALKMLIKNDILVCDGGNLQLSLRMHSKRMVCRCFRAPPPGTFEHAYLYNTLYFCAEGESKIHLWRDSRHPENVEYVDVATFERYFVTDDLGEATPEGDHPR